MRYSISDLEQLSGIQAHTIRMWEQRYHALSPLRSEGNTRYYTDQHLVRLLNIASISQQGLKISQICSLSEAAIAELIDTEIKATISSNQQAEFYITQLLRSGIAYDERTFDELLSKYIKNYGLKSTYVDVLYPLLVRLGLMWRKDSICAAQEHFLSNIIRQKIAVAINEIPYPQENATKWLLFLPQEEEHEIGILFAHYLLRQHGQQVIYLGSRVPMKSVEQAIAANDIQHILLFMVNVKQRIYAQNYIDSLSANNIGIQIHLAGSGKLLADLQLPKNVNWIKGIEEFSMLAGSTYGEA